MIVNLHCVVICYVFFSIPFCSLTFSNCNLTVCKIITCDTMIIVGSHYDDEKFILRMRRRTRRRKPEQNKKRSDGINVREGWTLSKEQSQTHKTKTSENFNSQEFHPFAFLFLTDPECEWWTSSTGINQSCSPRLWRACLLMPVWKSEGIYSVKEYGEWPELI